jgi:hypothetical protein
MPDESKQSARLNMQPEGIIRSVKLHYRICRYLSITGLSWLCTGAIFHVFSSLIKDEWVKDTSFMIEMIGLAIVSVAFAFKLAIYRCPVCDTKLSYFHSEQIDCPNCDAKLK